ncbi:uncharacterized protein LOC119167925 isoform X2 [Rhipicephalus microplus]|uniref:uncharacterized protein LOC119167925 isoform X2 n=1 Tax=Rhipicephalus microplus TaxID=6941 RepID=UPI003F6D0151
MKLLIYAVLFCLVIYGIATEGEEEEQEGGGGEGGGGEGGGGSGEKSKESEASTSLTTPTATTTTASTTSSSASSKGGEDDKGETKGKGKGRMKLPRRCRLSPAKVNCVGNHRLRLWFYNSTSEVCERHDAGGCSQLVGGFLLCPQCMRSCNRKISARKFCLKPK